MKLRYSAGSPFVRKTTVAIIELGLDGKVERVPTDTWSADTDLARDNPLGKVPTLRLDDGTTLYDSAVICAYLDTLSDKASLIPAGGMARFTTLRREALCDGIMDAGVLVAYESMRRPEALRWDVWLTRQRDKIIRGLDALEREIGDFGAAVTVGHIAAGCACGYLDWRGQIGDWRPGRPKLAAWYEEFAKRPSMAASAPK